MGEVSSSIFILNICLIKGQPSIAGLSLFSNSPPDYLKIHLLPSSLKAQEISSSADDDGGSAPQPRKPFKERLDPNLFNISIYCLRLLKIHKQITFYHTVIKLTFLVGFFTEKLLKILVR